ncbi:MAG: hypothetical protein KGQ60_19310, partial [Planctomycetes bacterium]|nr:hypothetical protein [Planctomycetota bacterium]
MNSKKSPPPSGPWQIGMLKGDSLDSLKGGSPAQPLFDSSLLRSIGGCGAADPFAFLLDNRW